MTPRKPRRRYEFYQLEERVMFGSDGTAEYEALYADDGETYEEMVARLGAMPVTPAQPTQTLNPEVAPRTTDDDSSNDLSGSNSDEELELDQWVDSSVFVPFTRTEVVFVDARVEQADDLIAGLQAAANPNEVIDWLVIRLQSDRDGIQQIGEHLAQFSNIDAVHLISHGSGAGIQLGESHLSLESAAGYSTDIARWGLSLNADADILIYGCDLASTEDGRALVDAIAMLTGADVAASDDATGHESLGGDWDFEYVVGNIETPVAVSQDVLSQWTYTLDSELVVADEDDSLLVDPTLGVTDFERHELVFVDTGVADYESILADLQSRSGADTWLHIALIDSESDGLVQVNDYLSQLGHPLDAIHFITHGTDRAFKFGSSWFDANNANSRQAEFAQWSNSLKSGGDLLFYGCDLASTQAGRDLLGSIAQWTGLDIAASETLVGAESLGGNWLLEYNVGEIETQVIVSAALQAEWEGLLATFTVTNTNDSGAGSLRQAILDANALAGHDTIQFAIGATGSFQTIGITSTLTITDSVTINGRTQGGAGYEGQPLIHVFRSSGTVNAGMHVQSSNVTITGIGVGGFTQDGILVENVSNFTLTNSAIGINPSTLSQNANSRDGVRLNNVTNSMIGGTTFADRNMIALNGQRGVNILGSSNNVAVLGNLFQGNSTLDLDLGGTGVTLNDNLDGDAGANGLQNFPVLSTAESSPNGTRIAGNFNSNGNTTYRIEVFGTLSGSQHSSGYGGGRTFLGAFNVTTDVMGNANYDTTVQGWVNAGDRVTATATVVLGGGFGSTSEFSLQVTATSSGVVVVNTNSNVSDGTTTSITNLQASRGADGRISLREAIIAANNTTNNGGTPDLIAFDILSWSGATISVTGSNLASITDAVRLDASTQRGYAGTPLISLVNGDSRSVGFNLLAGSAGSTVRGFNIQGFSTAGISIVSNSNTIAGNWIGTNATGTGAAGNFDGINLFEGDNNIIGGTGANDRNVISGNTRDGINISGSANNTQILGNTIGLNAAGTGALANSWSGVAAFDSSGTIIGNGTVAGRNVISGNGHRGIYLSNADNAVIRGNYIGTNAAGNADVNGTTANNLQSGIVLLAGSSGVTIGGLSAGQGNVISGNNWYGVEFVNAGTANNLMVGNIVGLNAAGTAALGNSGGGVSFFNGASNNTLGGGQAGARNIISGNTGPGVYIANNNPTGNKVQGNYIGLAADGVTAFGNSGHGVHILDTATNNIIGTDNDGSHDAGERNVISANVNGIIIEAVGTSSNLVAGNYIGTDATGTLDRGNTIDGIRIEGGATNNTIGGTNANQRNVISGNDARGIVIQGSGTNFNIVRGNYIGTNAAGTTALGNAGSGVAVWNGAQSNTIGGSVAGAGNVISGNGNDGITISDTGTNGTAIQGNMIGVNATATAKLGNLAQGIWVGAGAQTTVIGGAGAGAGNIIGGNTFAGVELNGANTSNNFVYGNFIGTNTTASLDLGNSIDGILITSGANNNSIGGTLAGAGNTIAFNGRDGVRIESSAGSGNAILGNRIYSNAGLGINLVGGSQNSFGVTANDLGDGDTGPNGLQNFPVVSSVTIDGTNVTVAGTLNSIPNRTYRVEVFGSSEAAASGYGQGQRYLGTFNVTSDGSGNVSFNQTLAGVTLAAGEFISYTATDLTTNNTSEFSYAVMATLLVNTVPSALKATGTTQGGLSINANDPSGDAYLVAENGGAIFGGRTALTVEIQAVFAPLSNGSDTLIEYQLPGGTDEFRLTRVNVNNALWMTINGTEIQITGFDFSTLHDGQSHLLAVTWNSSGGAWSVYVDGAVVASGTGLKSGHTLLSGGELIIGQQQNSAGGFDVNRGWQATLQDLRIFSDIRTASEIAASYRSDLPYNEQGMIANWRFNDLSTAGVTTDAVAGNNLTLANTGQGSHVAGTANLVFALNENALTGTLVGQVTSVDLEREARITQLLAADPSLVYSTETGKFYKAVDSTVLWSDAQTTAQNTSLNGVNGQLVTIRSAHENELVRQIAANAIGFDIWIGATDSTVEGEWRWVNGGSESDLFWRGNQTGYNVSGAYHNFQVGQPNDVGNNEDVARLDMTTGKWFDADHDVHSHRILIEWNSDAVLDTTNAQTYSIHSQTVSGAFTIDASTGRITVADGSLLDYETNATHTLTIRVSDGTNTYDQAFSVSLNDLAESNNAPTNLSSGIELNTDGGNDAYLFTTNGGPIFGNQPSVTLEATFQIDTPNSLSTILSYASTTGTNEVVLQVGSTGVVRFYFDSVLRVSAQAYPELLDGQKHHIAVSWDASSGAAQLYVNGEFKQAFTGVATGATLGNSGTITLGQEQDSVGGAFETQEAFKGTLHDVRVWNQVRSEAEIALNYQHKFDSGSLPSGLVANWQMDGFNGSNQVVDIVSGNNLSVGHATGAGFTTSTPRVDLNISENSVGGTSVGFVVASDPDISNDVVSDGLFLEAPDPGLHSQYFLGQNIGNWVVTSGDVELIGTTFQAPPTGGRSIDLNGGLPGAISQTLTTVAGRQYQVVFALSGNFSGGDAVKDLRVSADGISQDFSISTPSGWSTSNMLYSDRSMTFTAEDASTLLSFQSLDGVNAFGPVIGNIRVIEIPHAVTTILNNDPTLQYDAATNKFYRYVNSFVDQATAKSAALSATLNGVSGDLVRIDSAYENELVRSLLGTDYHSWLNAMDSIVEGEWRWYEGNTADDLFWTGTGGGTPAQGAYANFVPGEPNDSGDFLVIRGATGQWDDIDNPGTATYTIQWDASEVLSNFTFSLTNDAGGRFAIDASTGEITVADGSQIDYEIATSHNITVQVTDAAGNSYSEMMSIAVDNRGGEPSQTIPIATQNINEDTPLVFNTAGGNAITISDTLGSSNTPLQVVLQVNNGTLTLSQTTGLTIPGGANGSGFMVLQGTESAINAALEGMTYTPTANYNGSDSLSVTTSLGANLEGHYTFDGGNANDQSVGTSQNGALTGGATTVIDPERGEVLSLDGVDDYVAIAGLFGNPANVTLAAWVDLNSADIMAAELISLGNNVSLRVDRASSGVQASIYNGSTWTNLNTGIFIAGTGWRHVAYTFDDVNNLHRIYIDGHLIAEATISDSIVYNPGFGTSTIIGAHGNNNPDWDFNGRIDDARIYTRALSADEIAALATDQTLATGSVAIQVNPVNDAPVLIPYAPTYNTTEDAAPFSASVATLLSSSVTDVDSGAVEGIAIHAISGSAGLLQYSTNGGSTWTDIGAVSADNALLLRSTDIVRFSPNGQNGGTMTIDYRAWDQTSGSAGIKADATITGGTTAFSSANDRVTINVSDMNDAPVLDNAGTMTLNSITEDDINNAGQAVASVIASAGGDRITDVDNGAVEGIAIVGLNSGFGKWQYSLNGGSTWIDVGAVSNTSALLLRSTDSIRFLPQYENGSNPDFTFRAWDQTTGTAGSKVSTASSGGTTAFSSATETASILVTDVNDAPLLDPSRSPVLGSINEDAGLPVGAVGTLVSSLVDFQLPSGQVDNVADDDIGALLGMAITGTNTANGAWYYSTNNGTNWQVLGSVSDTSARLLAADSNTRIYFAPAADYNGTIHDAITFRAWDQTSGTNGSLADTLINGGATAFSIATDTAAITIIAVNDAPVAIADNAIAVEAGGVSNGTAGTNPTGNVLANDTDVDTGDTKTVIGVSAGVQPLGASPVSAPTTGTYGSIIIDADGSYTYNLDNNNTAVQALNVGQSLDDVFTYTMQDSGGLTSTTQITITIQGANDEQVIATNTGSTVLEGSTANVITAAMLQTTDVDNTNSQLVYTVASLPANGSLRVGGTLIAGGSTFTQADIDAGLVTYDHDDSQTSSDSFTFTVDDGSGTTSNGTFNFTITNVNDAPVLDNSLNVQLDSQLEDSGPPVGAVGTIVRDIAQLGVNVSDVDGDQVGIAITAANTAHGNWWFSLDNGSTWEQLGNVSESSARLLNSNSNTRLYFEPNLNFNGTINDAITFRAWDRTVGQNGTLQDATTFGGTSAFSTDIETASLTIVAVNDAPVQTSIEATPISFTENDAPVVITSNLTMSDIDDTHIESAVVAITGNYASGQDALAFTNQNGITGTWNATTGELTLTGSATLAQYEAALRSVTYTNTSDAPSTATRTVSFTVNDGDANSNTQTRDIEITAVNDAPLLDNNSPFAMTSITEDDINNSGQTVASIIASAGGDRITDPDGPSLLEGIAIRTLTSGNGTWQYSLDDGANWTNIAPVLNGSALLLRDVDRVRFVPNGENGTTASFTFRAWDQTTGSAGDKVSTASGFNGGTTAISNAIGTVNLSVTSINDAPVAVADNAIAVEAGGTANNTAGSNPTGNVLDNDTDVDTGDTKTVIGVSAGAAALAGGPVSSPITGTYGSITIAADGSYTYNVDNDNTAVQALNVGQSLTDIFTYTMQDSGGLTGTTQITITIQGANDAPHDIAGSGLNVDENSANTTIVGTVTGQDVDAGETFTYSLLDSASGRFAINNAGQITVADGTLLDREANASHTITVQVTDASGASFDKQFIIQINDVNEFAVTTPVDNNTAANSVAEDAAVGTAVGITALASDADATTNTVTYTLDDSAGGLFAIDATTGEVTVAAALDYETAISHNITVRATSQDGSHAIEVFTIQVTDVNESVVSAITDTNTDADYVLENATIGTNVGIQALATDADGTDTVSYSLDDDAGGRFIIDPTTGIVTVAGPIDREAAASYNITIRATSTDTSFSTQLFTIAIGDVDEFDVTVPTDTDLSDNEVNENVVIGTSVGITANAFDLDATNNTITYSLTSNADNLFQIDPNTGVVTTAAAIDREAHGATCSITVQATSSDGSTASQTFNITINDLDEFDVTVPTDTDLANNQVNENVAIGTNVGITANAFDLDATNNTITYSLTSNADNLFQIDPSTGAVTTAASIDREVHGATRSITVQATSSDGSTATQTFNITINDLDEFDVTVPTDTDLSNNEVNENVVIGTTVGITANAFDLDATNSTITYSLTSNADNLFQIDPNTGVVTTAAAIDRETQGATRSITVQAASSDGSTASQTFNIAINDLDEFDVTVPTDTDLANNEVNENVAIGTNVGITANAFDLDATNSTITYSLTSNADNLFQIDPSTGVVTTAAGIDREAHGATRSITVQAASSDGSTASQTFNIAINDLDEFDVTVPTDTDLANNEVNENVVIGTTVGITANAFDLDATNNAVTYSLTSNADNLFQIDPNTGAVTTAASIDREVHGATRSITVQATSSDGSTATQTFNITINDLDEFDVTVPTDTDLSNNEVNENVVIGTTVGITANAFDLDATNNTITYSLTSNADNLFQIDPNTGVVTTAAAIDRETHGATRSITVQATSSDGSTASQTFNITINDLDEFDVTVPTDIDTDDNQVDENVVVGTTVGITANAFDLDATNNTITYSLTSNTDNLFQIDPSTGVVTTAASIDRETHGATRSITVQATSSDGSTSNQLFNITINDVNEFNVTAISDTDTASNTVAEDAAIGTAVGITAFASDADATNNSITYTLDDNAGGLFAIDATTGTVTVAAALDYETAVSHNITVRATSVDGSSSTQVFIINVTDVNESAVSTISDTNAGADYVLENATIGTTVGIHALATDADGTDTVSYSLDDDAGGRFAIDSTTGIVTVAGAIDREAAASYNITIRATSTDTSTTTQAFTIAIGDVNEFAVTAPVDNDPTTNAVAENSANGTLVGITALAVDADATTNTITYSLDTSAGGRFAIDATTGAVSVADGSLLDFETAISHNITVRASSSDGSTATSVMTIQIIDVNENPIAIADTAIAVEAGGITNGTAGTNPTGNVLANDTDVDAGDTKEIVGVAAGSLANASGYVAAPITGTYGSITIAADGSYTYSVDNNNPTVQALASAADTLQDIFTYTMQDSGGLTSTTQITITIQGANDAPLISVTAGDSQSSTLAETNSGLTTQGSLSVTDVDVTNTVTATITNVNASGTTTGLLSNNAALQSMLAINSNIIGNDSTTGKINWTFDSSVEAFQYLAVGQSLILTYTIAVEDSAGAIDIEEVTITIQGTNDAPIASTGSASGSEDDATITGQLIATDADATDTLTYSLVSGPTSGSVSVASDGEFTFVPGSAFQDLAVGESRAVTFVFQVADNQNATAQQTVTVTISGRNDAPVITIGGSDSDTTNLAETGTTLVATGTMTVSDIDRSDVVTATVTGVTIGGDIAGLSSSAAQVLAMFSVTQNVVDSTSQSGSLQWWFDSQNEYFDYLLTDEEVHLTYEITVTDQSGLTSTRSAHFFITTNNLAPIAAGESYTIRPNERLTLAAPGPLVNDYDPDGDAIQFVLVSGPTWGTLTVNPNGQLTYQPGSQYAALDTIRYRVTDGRLYSETVEIKINTVAVPVQEASVPQAPGGETNVIPSDAGGNLADDLNDAATKVNAAENGSGGVDNGVKSSATGQEILILAREYVATGGLNERDLASRRAIESVGWDFEQTFVSIADDQSSFSQQLQSLRDEMIVSIAPNTTNGIVNSIAELKLGTAIFATANATLSAATAGTVFWALRGAALVATIASGMPALRNLDPANLLAEYRGGKDQRGDDDELELMVDSSETQNGRK